METIIDTQTFIADPAKYFNASANTAITINTEYGERFLLSREELENIELLQAMSEAEKEVEAGHFVTHEAVWAKVDALLA